MRLRDHGYLDDARFAKAFVRSRTDKYFTKSREVVEKVGDRVNLDGVSAEVTVVDQTRVYEIEGKAPDWVSVGDVAQYFNAEAGGKMWVVSWSGDEVEYYRGMQLHPGAVAQALRLPEDSFRPAAGGGLVRSGSSGGGWNIGTLATLFVLGIGWILKEKTKTKNNEKAILFQQRELCL